MTQQAGVRLQPLARSKVTALGERGRLWHESLPTVLAELADQWSLTIGAGLPGGSASYVVRARNRDGQERVVKVAMPGHVLTREAAVLAAADGHGYTRIDAYDAERDAILMESLSTGLEWLGWSPERMLTSLADTLSQAWQLPLETVAPVGVGVEGGVDDKATTLHALVSDLWPQLGKPCPQQVVDQALRFADRRAAAFDEDRCVVVHGDPHPANVLRASEPRAGAESGFVLVDPDGFRCEAAYDLGVVLRDWSSQLRGPDPRGVLEGYCALLAARSGLDAQAIWEWGYLERVSTGLYVMGFGAERVGRPFLESAKRLLD